MARQKVEEAEAYLEEVKNLPGSPHGAIWWMERELHEEKKSCPPIREASAKSKPHPDMHTKSFFFL